MDPALWEELRTGEPPQEEIEAIVRLDRPEAGVAGLRIIARFGPIATCRLRRDAILQVHDEENVISLKAARVFAPEPDEEASDEALPLSSLPGDVRRPPGLAYTGAGVVIGIVDWGCDFQHPNFRNADGSTRLMALWDQRGALSSASNHRYGYGRIHTRAEIDRALQNDEPYKALRYHPGDTDPAGSGMHGTHVMDIAAGNGRGGGPVGVAPDADLIFVHLANQDTGGLANLGDSVRILEACDFIARLADSRPWVINLSVGRHGGPHDGSSLCELAFDYLLTAGPNRLICQSTGNYFDRGIHASGRLYAGEERTLSMIIDEADTTPNELEIWYSGKDEFAIRLESPTGMVSPWVGLGEDVDLIENGLKIGRIYNRAFDPNNADHHADTFLYPAAPPGLWRVTIQAVRALDGSFHAWLERDDACPTCQTYFVETDVDRFYTTGTLANSQIPLVVGAYNLHSPSREISRYSSAGPTRDNRSKPDVVAPGDQVLAARSAARGWRSNPGLLVRKSGSSMATPHVTGAVALCLQAARRPLQSYEIRDLILEHVEPVTGDRQVSLRYGRGYLNISGSVQAAEGLSPVASPVVRDSETAQPDVYLMEEEMGSSNDDQYLDLLDQVITEPAARAASEKNLLAQILRIHGLSFEPREADPDRLYRELISGRSGGQAKRLAGHFLVLARPGEILRSPPQKGDILLRVVLGHPGLGHVAVIVDPSLWPDEELSQAPFESERKEPGYYAVVSEAGACPHPQSQPFARRVLNKLKQMLPYQILIRPRPGRQSELSTFDSPPLVNTWEEKSEFFLPREASWEESWEQRVTDTLESEEDCGCAEQPEMLEETAWNDEEAVDEQWSEEDLPAKITKVKSPDEIIVSRANGTLYHVRRKVRARVLTDPGRLRIGWCWNDERVFARATWCQGTQGTIDAGANLTGAAKRLLDTVVDQFRQGARPEEIARTLERAQVQTFVELAIVKDRNWKFTGDFRLELNPSRIVSKTAGISFDKGPFKVGVEYKDDGTGKLGIVKVDIPLGKRTVRGKPCEPKELMIWWDAECLREVPTTDKIQVRDLRPLEETLYLYFEKAKDILRRDPKTTTEPVDVIDQILRSSPKRGTALLNKRTLERLDYLVGQGYWLEKVAGYASPEGRRGPPEPRDRGAAAKWEGNDALSEERAKKVLKLIYARYVDTTTLRMRHLPPRMVFPPDKSMPTVVGLSENPNIALEGAELDRKMIHSFLTEHHGELARMTEEDRNYVIDPRISERNRAERLFENLRRVEIHLRRREKLLGVDVPGISLVHEHDCPPDVIQAAEWHWGSRIPFTKPDSPICG